MKPSAISFACVLGYATFGCDAPKTEKAKPLVLAAQVTAAPILVDGSSTLDPLNRGVVDLYASELVSDVKLEVSGTGGGFKKFCRKQSHINGASRPITSPEQKLCAENGVEFVELPVAFDAVALVVPRSNEWLKSLTMNQLKKLWEPAAEGSVKTWSAVDAKFPKEPLRLFGPSIDNGTFDFFTEAVVGQAGQIRADYEANNKHGLVAEEIGKSPYSLGFIGYAHYLKHEDTLRAIGVDDENDKNGSGPVEPSRASVAEGQYQPLSRPLFLYISKKELERREVASFVEFYLRSARLVAPDAGYTPLPKGLSALSKKRLDERRVGTIFEGGGSVVGVTIDELLSAETVAISAKSAR